MFEGEEDRDGSVCVSVAPQKTEKNEVPNLKKLLRTQLFR